jgi:hypothetical protein
MGTREDRRDQSPFEKSFRPLIAFGANGWQGRPIFIFLSDAIPQVLISLHQPKINSSIIYFPDKVFYQLRDGDRSDEPSFRQTVPIDPLAWPLGESFV